MTADGPPVVNRPGGEPAGHSVIAQGAGQASGNLWGVPLVATTQLAAGTAIVASIRAGGGIWWQWLGLLLQFDPFSGADGSNFADKLYTWRLEQRVALSVPRPSAVNIVTGLPTA